MIGSTSAMQKPSQGSAAATRSLAVRSSMIFERRQSSFPPDALRAGGIPIEPRYRIAQWSGIGLCAPYRGLPPATVCRLIDPAGDEASARRLLGDRRVGDRAGSPGSPVTSAGALWRDGRATLPAILRR